MHRKLCLEVCEGIDEEDLYPYTKEVGFDGFFTPPEVAHDLNRLRTMKSFAEGFGLFQETVHSTIRNCWTIWYEGEEGDRYTEVLLGNVENCAALGVPILVVHPQSSRHPDPDISLGLSRFRKVVDRAKELGVRIAFENTDSEELLDAVMNAFREEHVGFCYDSGHEFWLTPDADYLGRYGYRLFCLHLNDNDGTGDKHWLPGDGDANFERIISRLKFFPFRGPVTLEVAYREPYTKRYTRYEFIRKCYEVAVNLAEKLG